jgi:hypothetical protein
MILIQYTFSRLSSSSASTTTTMSARSKFYVPFLVAGMIFTVRFSLHPLVFTTLNYSPRVLVIPSGPSTRTSNASRTVTRTILCSTNNQSGRPSRCSARPLYPVSPFPASNGSCVIAGEMLCEYHHDLVHSSRLIYSP